MDRKYISAGLKGLMFIAVLAAFPYYLLHYTDTSDIAERFAGFGRNAGLRELMPRAEAGDTNAQVAAAKLMMRAGTEDRVRAYAWLKIAKEGADETLAREIQPRLATLEAELPAEQKARAMDAVQRFKAEAAGKSRPATR